MASTGIVGATVVTLGMIALPMVDKRYDQISTGTVRPPARWANYSAFHIARADGTFYPMRIHRTLNMGIFAPKLCLLAIVWGLSSPAQFWWVCTSFISDCFVIYPSKMPSVQRENAVDVV